MTEHGAEEHLHAIRRLMERATIYRAISAPAALVGGLLSVALAAGMLLWQSADNSRNIDAHQFFTQWVMVFLLTLAANLFFIVRGTRERGENSVSAGMKLAVRAIAPNFFAGGAVSMILVMTTDVPLYPAIFWLVFYGLGLLSTMSFAPRSIITLGWAFLITGIALLVYFMNQTLLPEMDLPTPTRFYPAAIMGATFGVYHLLYALWVWRRRGHPLDAVERRPLVTHSYPPLP